MQDSTNPNDLGENIEEVAAQPGRGISSNGLVALKSDIDTESAAELSKIEALVGPDPPTAPTAPEFNGGHFNLVLRNLSFPIPQDAQNFQKALGGGWDGVRQDAVYGNPAQGNYTLHSHGKLQSSGSLRMRNFNAHFDIYNPWKDVVGTIGHLFGDVIGGHLGKPCLDPAWQ